MFGKRYSHLIQRAFLGMILGFLYAALDFDETHMLVIGAGTGLMIGIVTAWLDHYVFQGKLKRLRFLTLLVIRSIAYLAVIGASVFLIGWIYTKANPAYPPIWEHLAEGDYKTWLIKGSFTRVVVYSFIFLLIFNYINLTSRFLGPYVLRNFFFGRYHQPMEEERIFMFLDIRSSTSLAEKLGHFDWHRMLNDFFFDIGAPIYRSKGSIYQYVGDEVVVSWPKQRGAQNINCIHCFYRIRKRIHARRERYLRRYGFIPVFKAGLHIGKVVTGEIGDYKRDMVFHGDTVNTAARIQDECNLLNRRILLSEELLNALELGGEFEPEFMKSILLRGKGEKINLYSLIPSKSDIAHLSRTFDNVTEFLVEKSEV